MNNQKLAATTRAPHDAAKHQADPTQTSRCFPPLRHASRSPKTHAACHSREMPPPTNPHHAASHQSPPHESPSPHASPRRAQPSHLRETHGESAHPTLHAKVSMHHQACQIPERPQPHPDSSTNWHDQTRRDFSAPAGLGNFLPLSTSILPHAPLPCPATTPSRLHAAPQEHAPLPTKTSHFHHYPPTTAHSNSLHPHSTSGVQTVADAPASTPARLLRLPHTTTMPARAAMCRTMRQTILPPTPPLPKPIAHTQPQSHQPSPPRPLQTKAFARCDHSAKQTCRMPSNAWQANLWGVMRHHRRNYPPNLPDPDSLPARLKL